MFVPVSVVLFVPSKSVCIIDGIGRTCIGQLLLAAASRCQSKVGLLCAEGGFCNSAPFSLLCRVYEDMHRIEPNHTYTMTNRSQLNLGEMSTATAIFVEFFLIFVVAFYYSSK